MTELVILLAVGLVGFLVLSAFSAWKAKAPPPSSSPPPQTPEPTADPLHAAATYLQAIAERQRKEAIMENLRNLGVKQFTPINSVLPAEVVPHPATQMNKKPEAPLPNV